MEREYRMRRKYRILGWILTALLTVIAAAQLLSFTRSKQHQVNLDAMQVTEYEDGSVGYSIGGFSLPKGNYTVLLYYELTGEDTLASLSVGLESGPVPQTLSAASSAPAVFPFSLAYPIDNGRLSVRTSAGSTFAPISLTFVSDRFIYMDGLIWALLCLLGIGIFWIMLVKINRGQADLLTYGVVLLLMLLTTLPSLLAKTQPLGVDLRGHLLRIDALYYGTLDHQFPVVIAPEWNNTYGQLDILYPYLFLYLPAFFRLLGMSVFGIIQLSILLVNVFGCIVFYRSSAVIFKNRRMKLLCTFLLMFEYSRIYGAYSGGRLGGSLLAGMFVPLVVAGLIDLFYQEREKWYYLPVGMAGIFCSHIISSVVTVLMVAVVFLFHIGQWKRKEIWTTVLKSLLLFGALIFGTYTAFLRYYFLDWSSTNLMWRDFLSTLWRISRPLFDLRWTSALILLTTCAILLLLGYLAERRKKSNGNGENVGELSDGSDRFGFVPCMFGAAFVFYFLATAYFPWELLRRVGLFRSLTDLLQSGNRFIGYPGMICAFCIPFLFAQVLEEKRWKDFRVITGVVLILLGFSGFVYAEHIYMASELRVYDEVTAEIEYPLEDYLPTGTTSTDYESAVGFISDESAVQTLEYSRAGTHVFYRYKALKDGVYVEFPKFYYEGYVAVDEAGRAVSLLKGDHNRIRVELHPTTEPKEIHIKYQVPVVISLSYLFSLLVWIVIILRAIKRRMPKA